MMRFLLFLQCVVLLLLISSLPVAAQPDLPQADTPAPLRSDLHQTLHVSPDGRYVVLLSLKIEFAGDKVRYDPAGALIQVWETNTGRLRWQSHSRANAYALGSFSPDGAQLLVHGRRVRQEGTNNVESVDCAELWELDTQKQLAAPTLEAGELLGQLVFSPDGQWLIGRTYQVESLPDGTKRVHRPAKVWEIKTGKLLRTMDQDPRLAQSTTWMAGSRFLASFTLQAAEEDNRNHRLDIWLLPELQHLRSHHTQDALVSRVAFSPDGQRAAFMTVIPIDGEVTNERGYLWDLESGAVTALTVPDALELRLHHLEFSPDGQTLAGMGHFTDQEQATRPRMWFWNARTGALERMLYNLPGTTLQTALLPDGKSFVIRTGTGKVESRSLTDGRLMREFEAAPLP